MSMHLLGPAYTTTNTRKRKTKFKSAEEKRQYESYQAWKAELKASVKEPTRPARLKVDYSFVRETAHIPSREESGQAVTPKKETRVYDGERKLLGIATLHKSVMQPVFDAEYAKDVARMRRG
jgi:hypothetical protein